MRTIKFRGLEANPYCEELRTFLYGTPLFITNEENYILPNFWDYEGLNKFKVLKKTISQFTGLFDKNGKEIYEGDILNVCNGSINGNGWFDKPYSVEFKCGKWDIPLFMWDKDGQVVMDCTHWCEVIGNIYENPELISKTPTHEH